MKFNFFNRAKKKPRNVDPQQRTSEASDFAAEYLHRMEAKQLKRMARDDAKHRHERQDERADCFAMGRLQLPDRGVTIDGIIREASPRGLTFRPASHYIEEMNGESIKILFEDVIRNGIIRSTRVDGYGIQLFDVLSDEHLERLHEVSLDLSDYRADV